MRSLFITAVYFSFFVYGLQAPFVFLLGYVWVDFFMPQFASYNFLATFPVSLCLGVATVFSLPFIRRDKFDRVPAISVLLLLFAGWMTLTLMWAEVPDTAFAKWDYAYKNIVIASMVPFILRGRVEFEAFVWTVVLSGMAHCLSFGPKVLLDGGSFYGAAKGFAPSSFGYGESSTLSMLSVSLIPFCLFLIKHSVIIPMGKGIRTLLYAFVAIAVLTSLGTFARTGMVSLLVLGIAMFITTKRKVLYSMLAIAAAVVAIGFMGATWQDRMTSSVDGNEGSAQGRVAVWLWTLDYVSSHPFGGSFDVYKINHFELPLPNGNILTVNAKAFHSIYFQVLGELGIPGALMFAALIIVTMVSLMKVRKIARQQDSLWLHDIANALLLSLLVYLAGGAFIGVAFQSYFYYLAALSAVVLGLAVKQANSTRAVPATQPTY